MKTFTLIIVVLILLGGAIAYQPAKDNQLNEQRYQSTVNIIEELSLKDKEINTLIIRSRFGLDQNYDGLVTASKQILEKASVLEREMRSQQLFSSGVGVQNYWDTYEKDLREKLDAIEAFKGNNSILRNSVAYAPEAGERAIKAIESFNLETITGAIDNINTTLYKYIASGNRRYLDSIKLEMLDLASATNAIEDRHSKRIFKEYLSHLRVVVEKQKDTANFMLEAVSNHNAETLMRIKTIYEGHHRDNLSQQKEQLSLLKNYNLVLCFILVLLTGWLFNSQRSSQAVE
ncbi:DAHL domain-containing protein [Agarilytica rhodophyticola]|uniref:DAHL domain-containing protein n=1 Tax=Agarilytica rhodophyticola TaxID=1737490 RepID=UPI000B344E22|nr:DAHL domain-containing protein [Agarilytica rhodophyticola]